MILVLPRVGVTVGETELELDVTGVGVTGERVTGMEVATAALEVPVPFGNRVTRFTLPNNR